MLVFRLYTERKVFCKMVRFAFWSCQTFVRQMRDSLRQFSQIVEIATPEEKKALIPRIVESITFTPTEIKIALFDHPIERGLLKLPPERNHFSDGALELLNWLPRPGSNQRHGG